MGGPHTAGGGGKVELLMPWEGCALGTAVCVWHLPLPEAGPSWYTQAQATACGADVGVCCLLLCVSRLLLHACHLPGGVTVSNRVAVTDAVGILSLG